LPTLQFKHVEGEANFLSRYNLWVRFDDDFCRLTIPIRVMKTTSFTG